MKVPKKHHGGAYIMVLTITMLLLMMVAVVLTITTVSRRVTALYTHNAGLYDLAVSGNEQALFLFRRAFDVHSNEVKLRALARVMAEPDFLGFYISGNTYLLTEVSNARFSDIFIDEAENVLRNLYGDVLSRVTTQEYRMTWNINIDVEVDGHTISDSYRAITTLIYCRHRGGRRIIRTNIRNYIDDISSFPTVVEASFNWRSTGHREIVLDAHTIDTLLFYGAVFPSPPVYGMIIILDEFALTMVESMRIDITNRARWRNQW